MFDTYRPSAWKCLQDGTPAAHAAPPTPALPCGPERLGGRGSRAVYLKRCAVSSSEEKKKIILTPFSIIIGRQRLQHPHCNQPGVCWRCCGEARHHSQRRRNWQSEWDKHAGPDAHGGGADPQDGRRRRRLGASFQPGNARFVLRFLSQTTSLHSLVTES